jgi:cystathionine beta-lyase
MFTHNKEFLEKIRAVVGYTSSNPLTSAASQAALSGECDEWIDEMNAYQDMVFSRFYDLVAENFPKAVATIAEGTYLAWVDVSAYTTDTKALEKKILDECHVYLEAGDAFGGPGFLRVNLGCPVSYLEEAVRRVAALL